MTDGTNANLETIVELSKRRGFIFPGSDIYGGLANSWDYGPLGVELKNNIKRLWWQRFVHQRADMVGVETAIVMNPRVWQASGHVSHFADELVECKKCHARFRSDAINLDDPCPQCGAKESFTEPAAFNTMFKTFVGPKEDASAVAYLRPETAQGMFVDFPAIVQTSRRRIPFGVAQVGKAFRNEITPGNFIFRTREFEQMEIEYFVRPDEWKDAFESWLKEMHGWIEFCGIDPKRVVDREIPADERAHYSQRTVDIEFIFPFGQKELYGIANRADYDLKLHAENSGQDFMYTDPDTGEKYLPHIIEPTFGVERTVLAVLLSAYDEEVVNGEKRTVLRLKPHLAPYQVAVLPLSKKDELIKVADSLSRQLREDFRVDYDITQSIGRRYRRQDEIGTPYCVTVDFDTLNDQQVTIRDRDSMSQDRIALAQVKDYLNDKFIHNK